MDPHYIPGGIVQQHAQIAEINDGMKPACKVGKQFFQRSVRRDGRRYLQQSAVASRQGMVFFFSDKLHTFESLPHPKARVESCRRTDPAELRIQIQMSLWGDWIQQGLCLQ